MSDRTTDTEDDVQVHWNHCESDACKYGEDTCPVVNAPGAHKATDGCIHGHTVPCTECARGQLIKDLRSNADSAWAVVRDRDAEIERLRNALILIRTENRANGYNERIADLINGVIK